MEKKSQYLELDTVLCQCAFLSKSVC